MREVTLKPELQGEGEPRHLARQETPSLNGARGLVVHLPEI
jgi:hypothetical protein